MKWFSYILSVYLLVLSCLPCADQEPVHSLQAQTQVSADAHRHSPIHLEDSCTPLCICTCCSGFTLQTNNFTHFQHIQLTGRPEFRVYTPENWLDLSYSIWQPPKLS